MVEDYAPCRLVDLDGGRYSLIYFEFEPFLDEIEEEGGTGGGFTWAAMIQAVMEMRGLEFPDVEFDPEPEMFSAVGTNTEVLEQIAAIIRDLVRDRVLMDEAIEHAKEEGYFE